MLTCWRKVKPVWFSKTALVIAILGFPPVYIASVCYGHVNALFPLFSSFGVFSPEKHWFRVLMISHALFNMAGNCFWFMIARSKIVNMTQSLIPHIINSSIRLLMIISGLCLIGLSIFDMENYGRIHFLMAVGSFTCHGISMLLGCYLMAKYFEKPLWFCYFRITLIVKMLIGAISSIISQWFWCFMMRKKLKQKSQSKIPQYICIFIGLVYTISGICIVLLSFFNMKDTNQLHFHLTLSNFICHAVAIPLSSLLIVCNFRSWKWFLLARIIVSLQMIIGSYFFVYYNRAGLLVLQAKNLFYIKENEPGYKEFNQCAISEWFMILGLIEITLITGLELRTCENQYEEINKAV